MTEEDEAFNDIERQAKQRKESVRAAVEKPHRPWVGLTDEDIDELHTAWVLEGGFLKLASQKCVSSKKVLSPISYDLHV